MRIISGKLKGLILKAQVSKTTRPTSDSVRENIFNILSSRIDFENLAVADLYAGTGSLGLEALSRGASNVVFVETDNFACNSITENISNVISKYPEFLKSLKLEKQPVLTFVNKEKNSKTFDVVLADPPYENDIEIEILSIVKPGGLLVYETTSRKLDEAKDIFNKNSNISEVIISRKMGNSAVVVCRV